MNKKLKVILGLIFFIYFSVYLFSLTFSKKAHEPRIYERVIVGATSPIQHIVEFTYEKISSAVMHYILLVHTSERNESLQQENDELRQKLIHDTELEQENMRLRTLLQLPIIPKYKSIYAEKIAFGSNGFERTIRINKGTNDGADVGMSVVNAQGVVGQIAEVYSGYSNVLLLTDKSNAVDVIIQRTRSRGILKGLTQHQLSFEFLSVDEDLQVGDVVISSGLDGVYPEGMNVGTVSALAKQGRRLFLTATVDPSVNFSKIEEVRILAPKDGK